jgi:hypothetical protein
MIAFNPARSCWQARRWFGIVTISDRIKRGKGCALLHRHGSAYRDAANGPCDRQRCHPARHSDVDGCR